MSMSSWSLSAADSSLHAVSGLVRFLVQIALSPFSCFLRDNAVVSLSSSVSVDNNNSCCSLFGEFNTYAVFCFFVFCFFFFFLNLDLDYLARKKIHYPHRLIASTGCMCIEFARTALFLLFLFYFLCIFW